MKSFKQFITEAGIVNMERYIRAHGKRPKSDGGPANYMFCTKRMGEPDHNDSKQVFQINATWNDAKKAVAKWAKEIGVSHVYMMEDTEIEEGFFGKPTPEKLKKQMTKAVNGAPEFKNMPSMKKSFMAKLDKASSAEDVNALAKELADMGIIQFSENNDA